MVIYVMKWDLLPNAEKEGYTTWSPTAIGRLLKVPGVQEFRAYRTVASDRQIVCTYEFKSMSDFSAWQESADVQAVRTELYQYANHVTCELWGPSPVVPEPIRP